MTGRISNLMKIAFTLAVGFSGIGYSVAAPAPVPPPKGVEPAEPTAEESKQAKEDFKRSVERDLDKIEKNIADLKAKASKASKETQAVIAKEISDLEARRTQVSALLKELSQSSGRAWTKFRSGLTKAVTELKAAYSEAQNEFSRKEEAETKEKASATDTTSDKKPGKKE